MIDKALKKQKMIKYIEIGREKLYNKKA